MWLAENRWFWCKTLAGRGGGRKGGIRRYLTMSGEHRWRHGRRHTSGLPTRIADPPFQLSRQAGWQAAADASIRRLASWAAEATLRAWEPSFTGRALAPNPAHFPIRLWESAPCGGLCTCANCVSVRITLTSRDAVLTLCQVCSCST